MPLQLQATISTSSDAILAALANCQYRNWRPFDRAATAIRIFRRPPPAGPGVRAGLDPASITGYLTDISGAEIPGTTFFGTAFSSGIGGGIVTLNDVVVAHGAYITLIDTAPAQPCQVRFGSGMLSNDPEAEPIAESFGAFPGDQELDGFLGMSDPRWWFAGAGRVVWIKAVSYDAEL